MGIECRSLRIRNSAPSRIESRTSLIVAALSAMRLSMRGRFTIADRMSRSSSAANLYMLSVRGMGAHRQRGPGADRGGAEKAPKPSGFTRTAVNSGKADVVFTARDKNGATLLFREGPLERTLERRPSCRKVERKVARIRLNQLAIRSDVVISAALKVHSWLLKP